MSDQTSLSLALLDFLPPLAFLTGVFYLVRIARLCRGAAGARMALAGGQLVFLGGFFKATWKLLYTVGAGDIQWMSQQQFVLASIGFLALFMAVFSLARERRLAPPSEAAPQKAMPQKADPDGAGPAGGLLAMAAWKIPFLFLMTVASLGAEGILATLAFQRGARLAAAGFVVGVLGILAMGALASAEQTTAMQWVEEIVNSAGQLGFMTGCILLYRDMKTQG